MTGWYEPKPPTPPEPASEGELPPTCTDVLDALALLPWMPLKGVIQQWAAFGAGVIEVEGLHATSVAFAALAQEREAMQTARYQLALRRPCDLPIERLLGFQRQQPIVSLLGQAASHWYEAASTLAQILEAPSMQEIERLPDGLSLRDLLDAALTQRERVWDLAHRLLLAHAQTASAGQDTPDSGGEEAQP
jgi:hypothetical protein